MVTATALGLLGPLAFLAAVALNAGLLWRAAPRLVAALSGVGPVLVPSTILPEGESNVVQLRPRLSPAAARPHRLAA